MARTVYIRRASGDYRTIDGWSTDRALAFPYLAHSGLLAWVLRDLARKGYRVDTVDGDPGHTVPAVAATIAPVLRDDDERDQDDYHGADL